MSTIVKFNNKILILNNKTVGWTAPVPPPVLYHVMTNGVNGTVVATPNTGYNGDTITLSNTPDAGYEFDSYSLTGATLYDTNKFDINNSDVNVVGNFIETAPAEILPYNIKGAYAYFNLHDLEYNKNYKINSQNIPSDAAALYFDVYNESWSTVTSFSVPNYTDYTFNLSNVISEAQYNNPYIDCWFMNHSWSPIDPMPSDISIVEA